MPDIPDRIPGCVDVLIHFRGGATKTLYNMLKVGVVVSERNFLHLTPGNQQAIITYEMEAEVESYEILTPSP